MNPHKTGMVLGTYFAVLDLIWVVLVALGIAPALMKFAYTAKMVSPAPTVTAFDLTAAIELLILAFVVGYIMGYIFGKVWHKVH